MRLTFLSRSFESYTYNLKALSLPASTTSKKPDPVALFNTALSLPALYHYDALHQTLTATSKLTSLPAVSQSLLSVLVSGSYKDFKALKNDSAELARKMRLLSLVDLARAGVVGFKDIRETLEIAEGEEEEWVVEGMRAGLIEGKINQLKGNVTIR